MATKKLTDLFVAKVKPTPGRRVEYFDATFGGLALRVSESGRKSWTLFYRIHGRQRRLTIGTYPKFMPAAAREAALAALADVEKGIDPAFEKKARRNDPLPEFETFEAALADYFAQHAAKNMAASTYAETKRQLERDVLPKWKNIPLREIKDRHALKLINEIAAAGNGVTANRTFSRLRLLQLGDRPVASRRVAGPKPETASQRAVARSRFDRRRDSLVLGRLP